MPGLSGDVQKKIRHNVESYVAIAESGRSLMGRPSQLTTDLANKVIQKVRAGSPPLIAAQEMGITRRNLNNWLQAAQRDAQLERDSIYRELAEGMEVARAEYISEVTAKGVEKLDGQYTGVKDIVLWLERVDPEHYRKRETHEIAARIDQRSLIENITSQEDEIDRLARTLSIMDELGIISRPAIAEDAANIIDAEIDEVHPGETAPEASDLSEP
jgi:predicted transcriptional regulator